MKAPLSQNFKYHASNAPSSGLQQSVGGTINS